MNPAGWCIPCREGTAWLRKMLDRFSRLGLGRSEDIDLIEELSKNMLGTHVLPRSVTLPAMPTISIVQKFRSEFEDHLKRPLRVQKYRSGFWVPLENHERTEISHVQNKRPRTASSAGNAGD